MNTQIPVPADHLGASDIVKHALTLDRHAREKYFESLFLAGNVPDNMRHLVKVEYTFPDSTGTGRKLAVFVTPDYLTLGTNDDALRTPLWPLTAQRIATAWNSMLPTTKMVTILWQAGTRVAPQPWGPPYDASMMSTDRFVKHNARINDQLKKMGHPIVPVDLLVGHKKDVVLTNKLVKKPNQVAIFGWHQSNGKPIQPLYLGHENTYADYAHGIRLISRTCELDGVADDLLRIARDPVLACGVSSEGVLALDGQPGA